MVLIPIILVLYAFFDKQISNITYSADLLYTAFWRDQLARVIQLSCLVTSIFLLPILMNIIFSSSLNYLFYIHRIKKTHIFITLFLINILAIFISMAHAI
jgi:hypothetical protein